MASALPTLFTLPSFLMGTYLFGFLLLRWVVHGRSATACTADYFGGGLYLLTVLVIELFMPDIVRAGPDLAETIRYDAYWSVALGTLLFLAGLWLVRLVRRILHTNQTVSPGVRATRRRLCALGMVLTVLLFFGANMVHAAVVGWYAHGDLGGHYARRHLIEAEGNLLFLGYMCWDYRGYHGSWPDNLEDLVKDPGIRLDPAYLADPREPDVGTTFRFLPPPQEYADPSTQPPLPFIVESYDRWPKDGILVAFTNWSVRQVATESEFKKLLWKRSELDFVHVP